MGFGDIFKASKNKQLAREIDELKTEILEARMKNVELQHRINQLEPLVVPEVEKVRELQTRIANMNIDLGAKRAEIENTKAEIEKANAELSKIVCDLESAKTKLIQTNDEILLQEFGLYRPRFNFASSDEYKQRLAEARATQKDMIKDGTAVVGGKGWTVNGSLTQGEKMITDLKKLLLRAFNGECDEAVNKVKFNNIDVSIKRITASKNAISRLGKMYQVSISEVYFQSKISEIYLAYEYQVKKQQEREEQKRIREELREQAKLQKEIEEARKEIAKEQKHYTNALSKINEQIQSIKNEEQRKSVLQKKSEIEARLAELDKSMEDIDYRAANQKAGYVYVISNIGAFGENVYKIGMTRRLNPMDRIDELSSASVPFNFDVHAMIFTENAPALETALHHAFDSKKINMVNTRREFFSVTLDEIEQVIKENFDKTVEFIRIPPAEQYRQSLLMRTTNENQ